MAEEEAMAQNKTKQQVNAVIRKPHKVHQRKKQYKISYFLRKHRISQQVSFKPTHPSTANYPKTLEQTHGCPAPRSYQNLGRNSQISIFEEKANWHADAFLPAKEAADAKEAVAFSNIGVFLEHALRELATADCVPAPTPAAGPNQPTAGLVQEDERDRQ